MTKRSAEEATRDELASEQALLTRLEEQETKRKAAVAEASDRLSATRRAIQESRRRIDQLNTALSAIARPTTEEGPDAAT